MKRWRCISVVLLFILGSSVYPTSTMTVSADISARDPNTIVPPEFAGDMEWSEQGNWHWVVYSYTGENVTTGTTIQPPYFVATKVRSLSSDDPCDDCLELAGNQQGPPLIMGGTDNPRLGSAYENLSNGPRYRIADATGESSAMWAAGAWYLNYNPASDRFTSWTWIPDARQGGASTLAADNPPETIDFEEMGDYMVMLPEGSRVFPLAPGTYRLTQAFGCVAHNHGYQSSGTCPADRPSFHNGTDFGASEGTTIYAAASGTVTFADIDSSSPNGNSVIRIEHDGVNSVFHSEYLHWIRSYVKSGDRVVAGQPIAEVGSVGYSTGPHLHYTVRDAATGVAIDPMIWLQSSTTPIASSISVDSVVVMNVLRWEPMIRAAAAKYDVPAALIAAIITVESSGNPNAVSPAGAQGLMQIMPMHLTRYGIASEFWRDPATNIDSGARYLSESLSGGSTIQQTAARYFGIGCDVLGTCTDQYIDRVLAWFAYYTALFAGDPLPGFPETQVVAAGESRTASSQAQPESVPQPPEPNRQPEPAPRAADPATNQEPASEPAPPDEPSNEPAPADPPPDEGIGESSDEPISADPPEEMAEEPAPEPSASPPSESTAAEQPSEGPPEESGPKPAPEPIPAETAEEESIDIEQSESVDSGQSSETPESGSAPEQERAEVPEPEQITKPEATTGSHEPSPSADEDSGVQESQESAPHDEAALDEANDVDEQQPVEHGDKSEAPADADEPVDETQQQSNEEQPAEETEAPASEPESVVPEADDSSPSTDVPDGGTESTEQNSEVTDVSPEVPDEDIVPEEIVPEAPLDPLLTEIEEDVTEVFERETSVNSSGGSPAEQESVTDQDPVDEEATESDPEPIMDQPDSGIDGEEMGEGEGESSEADVPLSDDESQIDVNVDGESLDENSDEQNDGDEED